SAESPAAAIILVAEETEQDFWNYAAEIEAKGSLALAGAPSNEPVAPPFFLLTTEATEALLGSPLADARQPRRDLGTMEYDIVSRVQPVEDYNVAAIAPGRDPALAGEYVAV